MARAGRAGILTLVRSIPRAPDPGTPGDPGLFGPGTMAWRIHGETAMLLGAGRALLMQVAHPSVAAGVADHSDFPHEPYERLWRTLDTTLTFTFGDSAQSERAADRVTAVHRRVEGTTPSGYPYRAMDPQLLLWVHATLVDSALVVHERFLGSLGPEERERYYREMERAAVALGVPPDRLPAGYGDFAKYVEETVGDLEVTDQARSLAQDILFPPAGLALRPAAEVFRLVTIGLLPPALRTEYGLSWGRFNDWMLAGTAVGVRSALRVSPSILRRWPHARSAERRVVSGRRPT